MKNAQKNLKTARDTYDVTSAALTIEKDAKEKRERDEALK